MSHVSLELDDELVEVLRPLNPSLSVAARELMVLELFRRSTISAGKAAESLRMSKQEFLARASQCGVPYFSLTEQEWEAERRQSEQL